MNDADKKDQTSLIPLANQGLTKRSANLVRRGLDRLMQKAQPPQMNIHLRRILQIVGSKTTLPDELPIEVRKKLMYKALLRTLRETPSPPFIQHRTSKSDDTNMDTE